MTLRVALVLDGDAAGAKQAVDETRSKFQQMVDGIDAASRKLAQSAGDTRTKLQQMVDGINAVNRASAQTFRPAAEAVKLNAMQVQNLTFQLNDMATMLASGQSPFVLMMQQGMQIAQIFGPRVGVAAALRAVGAAAISFAMNPLTLTVLGVAAAAGAVKLLWNAFSESDDAERALERHTDLVEQAKRAYTEAGGKAKEWVDQIERFTKFDAERSLQDQQKALQREVQTGMGILGSPGLQYAMLLPGQIGDQARELVELNRQVSNQEMTVEDYRAALDRLGQSTTFERVRDWVAMLRDASIDGLDLLNRVREAQRVVDDMGGKSAGVETTMTHEMRLRFGEGFGAFDALRKPLPVDRTAERHINDLKRVAQEWNERASPAVEDYMRELAKLDEAKQYFDTEAQYLRARVALQKEMTEAIAEERRERLESNTDLMSGIQRGLEDYARRAMDMASGVENAIKDAFKGAEDAIIEFTQTGKLSFSDLTRSILADVTRMAVRQGFTGPLASGLSSAFNFMVNGFQFHSGYGPGDAMTPRLIPAAVFAGAPRYHGGFLAPGERAAVLDEEESVLTPGQMRAMGNRSVTVKIELVDAQGTPVRAKDGGRRSQGGVDVQRLVVAAGAEDIAAGGPLARSIETTYGLSRRTR